MVVWSQDLNSLSDLKEAIATHTSRAAEKLRKQQQSATGITIFILTNRFKDSYYSKKIRSFELLLPSIHLRRPKEKMLVHAILLAGVNYP